ncbi:putative transcription factor C2H2 family [Lupinus albus]|uniref:RING-type E3 ubiquitin transferase n=1 Tax=Lupinus albus TaxID=3870 RepID=A0A6A4NR46_LUPAL|nr:putative transcription factor C2H2 family [Lupinus albus]
MHLHMAIVNTHHHRHLLNMPPSYKFNNNTRDSSVKNESNFDSNMVIVLAALLSALICALLLNSIVRCAMRCSRRFSNNETSEQTAVRLATKGLKKHELMKIPVAVYGSGENIKVTECPICLGEFEKGDKVRMLPKCNHGFHINCIDTWLVTHSSCPNCRHSLLLEKSSTKLSCFRSNDIDANNNNRLQENLSDQEGNLVVVLE